MPAVYKCYCAYCRKISGGAFQAVVGAQGFEVTQGADKVAPYNVSGTYVRNHCGTCHTFLWGQVTVAPGIPPYVACGAVDGDAVGSERPIEHLFVRSKVPWHAIGEAGTQHQAYPPM